MGDGLSLTRRFRVGKYLVSVSAPAPVANGTLHLALRWTPHKPVKLSKRELLAWRAGMQRASAELAAVVAALATDAELIFDNMQERSPDDTLQ